MSSMWYACYGGWRFTGIGDKSYSQCSLVECAGESHVIHIYGLLAGSLALYLHDDSRAVFLPDWRA